MSSVLVTRPGGTADPLVGRLEQLGHRVHAVPTVALEPRELSLDLTRYDWVVMTSAAAVPCLKGSLAGPRWAAVGRPTAAALAERGVTVDAIPEQSNGAAIAAAISPVSGARVLLARADAASSDLPELLGGAGAIVEEVIAYHTVEGPETSREPLLEALVDPGLESILLASGSAARGLVKLAGAVPGVPVVTIGPKTSAVARELGLTVRAEAVEATAEGLIEALRRTSR
jgi:uroporphyrinogen-III synthase